MSNSKDLITIQPVVTNESVSNQKSVAFNGRIQMKCVDIDYIRPFVERLLFPQGIPQPLDLTEVIQRHQTELEESVQKQKEYKLGCDHYKICQMDRFEACKSVVSFKGTFYDSTCFPGFRKKQVECTLKYSIVEHDLQITIEAEQYGFDIVVSPKYTKPRVLLDFPSKLASVNKVLMTSLQDSRSKIVHRKTVNSSIVICILIIEHMIDHLDALRQIKAKRRQISHIDSHVVLIIGDHSNDFTTTELTKYFASQNVTLLQADDL